MKKYIKFLIVFFVILQSTFSFAQIAKEKEADIPPPLTRILFIFDCSQSMFARWQSDTKINIAQNLISNMLDSLKKVDNLELALRVYGHQKNFPPQDCDDTKLEIPFSKKNINKIENKLKSLVPRGTTPIAFSLEKAAGDFPYCKDCRNIIILITDGMEECNGDPCAVSQLLQKKGLILKPFIIGIGKNFKESFDCVGTYFDATSEVEFNKALNVVISQALNSTTAQVNLLDEQGKPTETNVNMTFYDSFSGLIKYNFIHTMNNRGYPDTLTIDPLVKYDLVVHTIPPVKKNDIVLTPGKHTIIALDAPMGYMKLRLMGGSNTVNVKNLQCIVRKKGSSETLNLQYFNQSERYLCGNYDLEVLCMPRLIIKDVEIKQSNTTTIEIPMPGIAVINTLVNGYGSLYVMEENKMKWIYNLNESTTVESLILQPGTYKVVFRGKMSVKSISSIEKDFKIESGITTSVNMYRQ
ncbi:MAG: VWA domain-containing protein [Bacteroidetes bacterium]|nr:VWA domain-containing protein [Bacteroidota bacterium]